MSTLNTPILKSVGCFDPNNAYTFEFQYSGVQILKNRLVIVNNKTSAVIYDQVQEGMRQNHILSANILTTNTTYTAQVQVFDGVGNSSNLSAKVLFTCHLTPTFEFSNIQANSVITAANYEAQLSFAQKEGDSLQEFVFLLYDSNKIQISLSSTKYSSDAKSITYYGLENLTSYYFRAKGKTVYGFEVDTGYILASIKYTKIPANISFVGENKEGKIILTSNIVTTDYTLKNNQYTVSNGLLTLTDNTLTYNISEVDNYSIVVKAKALNFGEFLDIIGNDYTGKVSIEQIGSRYYGVFRIKNTLSTYTIFTNILGSEISSSSGSVIVDTDSNTLRVITTQFTNGTMITFQISYKDGVYGLIVNYE